MAHKIIENDREAYIIFEGNIDANDASDYHILELFDKNIKITLDISKVLCYNEFVIGYKELSNQFGATIKERTKDVKNPSVYDLGY